MTHSTSGQHAQQKMQIVKKEPSDTATCSSDNNATLIKPWQPTLGARPFFAPATASSNPRPGRAVSDESGLSGTQSVDEHFKKALFSSASEAMSSSSSMEPFSTSAAMTASTQDSQKQSRKRKAKPFLATRSKQRVSSGANTSWLNVRQKEHDSLLEQRIKEWKEKQAVWQSRRAMASNPAFNVAPRFPMSRDLTDPMAYSYEGHHYPMMSGETFFYRKGIGNFEHNVPTPGQEITVSSSGFLSSNRQEEGRTVGAFERGEPVIKEVVSLAEKTQHSETTSSTEGMRAKRTRKSFDESMEESNSDSGSSDNNGSSTSAGKYISDLAQPYTNIPDDHQVAHINGLLSLPSNRETRYGITYGELKRRCNSPESLTRVDLVAYVRHSKSSGRGLLDKYKIVSSNRSSRPTILSKMCENEARVLGDGILRMNNEYFPGKVLAQTAAARLKEQVKGTQHSGQKKDGGDELKNKIKEKMHEIQMTRSMLKETYDLLLSEKDREEMKTFELASHTFGTANLLNHLTLFDRFFEDYQTSLTSKKK